MRTFTFTWLAGLPCLCLLGCASVDNDVIVPPGSYTSHLIFSQSTQNSPKPSASDDPAKKLSWLMPLVEVDPEGFIHPAGIEIKGRADIDKSPIYTAYDISRLENGEFETLFPGAVNQVDADQKKAAYARNVLVKKVLYLSDKNFDTYALRKQTYNDDAKLFTSTLNTVGTATIGGTAIIAPPAAAGLALTKLITDSTVTNLQNSYLGGQTVDALFKAMAANRAKYETKITNKLFDTSNQGPSSYDSYPIMDVLGDFRQLNSISTLPGALEDIADTANTQTQAAKATTDSINKSQSALPQSELQKDLSSTTAQAVDSKK
jgi:hypothetical protein